MDRKQHLLTYCDCNNCPLYHQGKFNPVVGDGPGKASLAIVGEAPGRNEALQGKPFVGRSGQLLDSTLTKAGMSRKDVYVTNTVLCRPTDAAGNDAPPTPGAVAACRRRLEVELREADPKVVVACGASAAQSLLNEPKRTITELQGVLQYNEDLGQWILPTFHPAYCLRSPGNFEDFLGDMYRAADLCSGEIRFPARELIWNYTHYAYTDIEDYSEVPNGPNHRASDDAIREATVAKTFNKGRVIALDVETDGFSHLTAPLLTVQWADEEEAHVIDWELVLWDSQFREGKLYDALYDMFADKEITYAIHNQSFDLRFLRHNLGIHHSEMTTEDTMCFAQGLTERKGAIGLKFLSRKWFNAPYYEAEIQKYLKTKSTPYSKIPRPILAKYAAMDVIYTARLHPILEDQTKRAGTYNLCKNILMPAQLLFADIEYHGVKVDLEATKQIRAVWQPQLDTLVREIGDYAREHGWEGYLNPGSPQQMAKLLYDVMKLRPPKTSHQKAKAARAKGKEPSKETGKPFREMYMDTPGPGGWLADKLEQFALAKKMLSTYVNGIVDDIDIDGRVHPEFAVAGTVTGRLTLTKPPLQTIPRFQTSEKFGDIRNLFIAQRLDDEDDDNEYTFLAADYKQLELRVGWLLSHDYNMGSAILGGDFHRITAADIFKTSLERVTEIQRHNTKYVTFGLMYGREAYSLANGELNCSVSEAQMYLDGWFKRYPTFKEYFDKQRRDYRTKGMLTTPFNRIRRFPLLFPQGSEEDKHMKNQAVNFPMQSAANDITVKAAIRINQELYSRNWGRVLFLVHDSVESEVKVQYKEEAAQLIYDIMLELPEEIKDITPDRFALDADIEIGRSWGEGELWAPQQKQKAA